MVSQQQMLSFDPFAFLIEDPYSPRSRTLRTSLWSKMVDTFRVWCGSIGEEAIDEEFSLRLPSSDVVRTVGLIDHLTFMVPRLLHEILRYLEVVTSNLIDVSPYFVFIHAPIILTYLALSFVRALTCLILTALCFPFVLLKHLDSLKESQPIKEELTNLIGLSSYYFEECQIENIVFDVSEVRVVFAESGNYDALEKVFSGADLNHKRAWQIMRELNIGQINQKLRKGEYLYTEEAEKYHELRLTVQALAQGMRTKTSYFQTLPTELVISILQQSHINDLVEYEVDTTLYPVRWTLPRKSDEEIQTYREQQIAVKRAAYGRLFTKKFEQAHAEQVPHDEYYQEWLVKQEQDDADMRNAMRVGLTITD